MVIWKRDRKECKQVTRKSRWNNIKNIIDWVAKRVEENNIIQNQISKRTKYIK